MSTRMATEAKAVYAHIIKHPDVCGGSACIDATRIRVIDVCRRKAKATRLKGFKTFSPSS